MTLPELFLIRDTYQEQELKRIDLAKVTAWYSATLERQKRIPKLKTLLTKKTKKPAEVEKFVKEHQKIIKQFDPAKAFGGK